MEETLTKALHAARFVAGDLRWALAHCTAVESLILLPLVGDAARLAQQIEALHDARLTTETEDKEKN
jgi:hypothetical protein